MEAKRDYRMAFGIGAVAAVLWFFTINNLAIVNRNLLIVAVILIPIFFMIAVNLAHRFFKGHIFHKIVKFIIVGVHNTSIDFFVFNGFIFLTGIDSGIFLLVFKSISFLAALFNSYELNRSWTFNGESKSMRNKKQFIRFSIITFISFAVNVGTTAIIVDTIHPFFGLSAVRWDNVAAASATLLNFILNFTGYRLFVFNSDAS